jgi:preprotein translocase subunit SecY
MAGILARMPGALLRLLQQATLEVGTGRGQMGIETLLVLAGLFVGVVFGVVFITQGQRRIPTQSAKHVRGRRVYGGTRQYLPLRVNQAGVMPIIFASSLLLSGDDLQAFESGRAWPSATRLVNLGRFRAATSYIYNVLYVGLIYFFCYFWTAITFNPKDMANNLKDYGSFIPGYRPGKRTADYLEKVILRITYVGTGFTALVAILPANHLRRLGVDLGCEFLRRHLAAHRHQCGPSTSARRSTATW